MVSTIRGPKLSVMDPHWLTPGPGGPGATYRPAWDRAQPPRASRIPLQGLADFVRLLEISSLGQTSGHRFVRVMLAEEDAGRRCDVGVAGVARAENLGVHARTTSCTGAAAAHRLSRQSALTMRSDGDNRVRTHPGHRRRALNRRSSAGSRLPSAYAACSWISMNVPISAASVTLPTELLQHRIQIELLDLP